MSIENCSCSKDLNGLLVFFAGRTFVYGEYNEYTSGGSYWYNLENNPGLFARTDYTTVCFDPTFVATLTTLEIDCIQYQGFDVWRAIIQVICTEEPTNCEGGVSSSSQRIVEWEGFFDCDSEGRPTGSPHSKTNFNNPPDLTEDETTEGETPLSRCSNINIPTVIISRNTICPINTVVVRDCYCDSSGKSLTSLTVHGYNNNINEFQSEKSLPWTVVTIADVFNRNVLCEEAGFWNLNQPVAEYDIWQAGVSRSFLAQSLKYYLYYNSNSDILRVRVVAVCGTESGLQDTYEAFGAVSVNSYGLPNSSVSFSSYFSLIDGGALCEPEAPNLVFSSLEEPDTPECREDINEWCGLPGRSECYYPDGHANILVVDGSIPGPRLYEEDVDPPCHYFYETTIGQILYRTEAEASFSYSADPNLPDFVEVETLDRVPGWPSTFSAKRFFIPAGTKIRYEDYGDPESIETFFVISGFIGSPCPEETVELGFSLIEVNNEPALIDGQNRFIFSVCSGTTTNLTNINIIDGDIAEENRQFTCFLRGADRQYFLVNDIRLTNNVPNYLTLTAPISVSIGINARNLTDSNNYLNGQPLKGEIVFNSQSNDGNGNCPGFNYSETGYFTVHIANSELARINTYNFVPTIPQGLFSSTNNYITVAHKIHRDDKRINDSERFECFNDCISEFTIAYASAGLFYLVSPLSNNKNDLSVIINKNLDSFSQGDSISGSTKLSFNHNENIDTNDVFGLCCGYLTSTITDTLAVGPPLTSFATGIIANRIPFSGGQNNVEGSYFEPLGSDTIILVPQNSQSLGSNENYFYTYTYGESTYSGVKHPTATGIIEVVGAAQTSTIDDYVLCRYASNTDTIFQYRISTEAWSSLQPFGAGNNVTRVIKLEGNDGLYFVVGSGEYATYNVQNADIISVVKKIQVDLPPNIALIPNRVQKNCNFTTNDSDDMASYTNTYHIFALDHHYTSVASTGFPLLLNIVGHQQLEEPIIRPTIETGVFNLVGSTTYNTTYLHGYLNNRPDITTVADKVVISLANTGTLQNQLWIFDNTTYNLDNVISIENHDRRRVTKLMNDQILWSSYATTGQPIVVDPYTFSQFSFPTPLHASISVAASCPYEYRTLMMDTSGTKGYILNDLDRTYEEISFTGSLPMGKYHDMIVFKELINSISQAYNFYLMPTEIYQTGFPSGNLVSISTTTTGPTLLDFTGPFTINETNISFAESNQTQSRIEIGRFDASSADDEFAGVVSVVFDSTRGDPDIFEVDITNNSGIIYVKEGIALDYETRQSYTGYITGIDPYVGGPGFVGSFVLNVLDVSEKPTAISVSPSTAFISATQTFGTNFKVADIEVTDPDNDNTIAFNKIELVGPDYHIFTFTFNNADQRGTLSVKAGTVFDIDEQDEFRVRLLVFKNGETDFSAFTEFTLNLVNLPPYSVIISPSTTGINENYVIPSNLKLGDITLLDNDTPENNFIQLIGPDASYFSLNFSNNVGSISLVAGSVFDYETKTTVTGTVVAGNVPGQYSATGTFTINVLDINEPSGITVTPGIVRIKENVSYQSDYKLADLSWSANAGQGDMVIYDLRYPDGGYRSALDKFTIGDNSTTTPEIRLKAGEKFDYETQNIYYIWISGRPSSNTTNLYGGQLTIIVEDVDEAPTITFDPTTLSIPKTFDTSLDDFKIADIFALDEKLSSVSFSLDGIDNSLFTLNINNGIEDSSTAINVGELYLKKGIAFRPDIRSTYTARVIGVDVNGATGTGDFIITLTDDEAYGCPLIIETDTTDATCPDSQDGRIFLNISYTGENLDDITTCITGAPLSVQWRNLPENALTGIEGFVLDNLGTGTYSGIVYGGNVPLTGIQYSISTVSDLKLVQVLQNNPKCESSGTVFISWEGGVPPYDVTYGTSRTTVESEFSAILDVFRDSEVSGIPTVQDGAGCSVSGSTIIFDFISSSFTYESQTPPIIYDDTLESFMCYVSNGEGPYQVNLYSTTTGEKGSLIQVFDRFDTSIINRVDRLNNIIVDESGNESIRLNNPNPEIYYYDFQNKIYPGTYVFEFVNNDNCSILSEPQVLLNIEPVTVEINIAHDNPVDIGFYTISQPILDTLFIPYRMIFDNLDLVTYISNLTEKDDINFEINGLNYSRQVLNGSTTCEIYSSLNIKFLGVNDTDWFYTLPIYKGFDLTDQDIDILNSEIYLLLPNGKIKIVTELTNDINTIKLLKGSILTTDPNTGQYKQDMEIGLFNYDEELGDFVSMETKAKVTNIVNLYNKYIPGNIFKIDFLEDPNISSDLSVFSNYEFITTYEADAAIYPTLNFLISSTAINSLSQSNLSLFGLDSNKGQFLKLGDTVLFRNLTDSTKNGIYTIVPGAALTSPNNKPVEISTLIKFQRHSQYQSGFYMDNGARFGVAFNNASYVLNPTLPTTEKSQIGTDDLDFVTYVDPIYDIIFSCTNKRAQILENRKFLISLNTFGLFQNMYSKTTDNFEHDASIIVIPNGGYAEYTISYYYYNNETKCMSPLYYNNETLTTLNADRLKDGVYIVKLRDIYGNKLKTVNDTDYDYFHISALDFISNELNTTPEALNFEYGDIIANIVNLLNIPNPPTAIPGIQEPTPEPLDPPDPPVIITTDTYILSPNTDYTNSITIQTDPGKIEYTVTGPYGYKRKFFDKSVLVQLPPGVYTIIGDSDSLYRNYLYPKNQNINVTKNTNLLVNLNFESYENRVVINNDVCENQ